MKLANARDSLRLAWKGRETVRSVAAAGLFSVLLMMLPLNPAQAESLLFGCTASSTTTYTPPVTSTPHNTVTHGETDFTNCTGSPGIQSGEMSFTASKVRSCTNLFETGAGTSTITWNPTGETSTYSWNATTNTVGGQVTYTATGHVTSGTFQGETVILTIVSPDLTAQCLTAGISKRMGVGTLVIP